VRFIAPRLAPDGPEGAIAQPDAQELLKALNESHGSSLTEGPLDKIVHGAILLKQ
jgi:hypothetical protein